MAKGLFYPASYKNVGKLFATILTAKAPEAFTTVFLTDTIGLESTADRQLISMLKKLGFLEAGGSPTETYGLLKNKDTRGAAIADGLRKAYAPLFEANEKANDLTPEQLKVSSLNWRVARRTSPLETRMMFPHSSQRRA